MSKKMIEYTAVEKNIYKTKSGTYRVRVGDKSLTVSKLAKARMCKRIWNNQKNDRIW